MVYQMSFNATCKTAVQYYKLLLQIIGQYKNANIFLTLSSLYIKVALKAVVSGFSLFGKSYSSYHRHDLPVNGKPPTADLQACWYIVLEGKGLL